MMFHGDGKVATILAPGFVGQWQSECGAAHAPALICSAPVTLSLCPKESFHAYAFGETPSPDAPGKRELLPGTLVRVAEFLGDWVIVARDEEKMG